VNPVVESGKSELYRALDAALRRLPEDQRTAVILCDVYGMDYQEVSVVIRSPVGTVKSRIHRGRLRLRELLADQRELFED
jgi:RNA polymerase sigma-70 factor (ECF subfamily)